MSFIKKELTDLYRRGYAAAIAGKPIYLSKNLHFQAGWEDGAEELEKFREKLSKYYVKCGFKPLSKTQIKRPI